MTSPLAAINPVGHGVGEVGEKPFVLGEILPDFLNLVG